jgi:hypothetical protein
MKRPGYVSVICGLIFNLLCSLNANALVINSIYLDGEQQPTAVGAGNLRDIFSAAASVWERAILDPFTLTLNVGWAPIGGGQHRLLMQGGDPHRETSGEILFNNDTIDGHFVWFLDSDPLSNKSFEPLVEKSADLGGGLINVSRAAHSYSSIIGNDVLACAVCSDLFSAALHEIGHSLGMSAANWSYQTQSATGFINITDPLPHSGSSLPLVWNFKSTAHFENSDQLAWSVMSGGGGAGNRQFLSAADILGIAQLGHFKDINLDPMRTVAEPSSIALLLAGLLAAGFGRHRNSDSSRESLRSLCFSLRSRYSQ